MTGDQCGHCEVCHQICLESNQGRLVDNTITEPGKVLEGVKGWLFAAPNGSSHHLMVKASQSVLIGGRGKSKCLRVLIGAFSYSCLDGPDQLVLLFSVMLEKREGLLEAKRDPPVPNNSGHLFIYFASSRVDI